MFKQIIAILVLLLVGCTAIQTTSMSTIKDVKSDTMIGKTIKVEGKVLDWALDNHKCGWAKIQDNTGTIYLTGGCQLIGPFRGIYGVPSDGNKFNVEYAIGTLQKGFSGSQDYYVDLKTDLSAINIITLS